MKGASNDAHIMQLSEIAEDEHEDGSPKMRGHVRYRSETREGKLVLEKMVPKTMDVISSRDDDFNGA